MTATRLAVAIGGDLVSLKPLWHLHPHVRTGQELLIRERAADILKRTFGTWSMLGVVAAWITFWLIYMDDPGELRLNLALSCMAAVQGIVLQIAANRGDRQSSELALHTFENGQQILAINEQQMAILTELRELNARLDGDV